MLRRLSNAEYTYTLRDLTGVDSLDPAREFPVDGAAGEGFTNTGNALVMSPALAHEVSRRRQGDRQPRRAAAGRHSLLAQHHAARLDRRDCSRRSATSIASSPTPAAATQVNLQGIVFDTNDGGRLPLEKYLAATLAEREALDDGPQDDRRRGPRARAEREVSRHALGEPRRAPSRRCCSTASAPAGARQAGRRRRARRRRSPPGRRTLADSRSVGHIGKVGGPKAWMEPVNPADRAAGVAAQDSGVARRRGRHALARRVATPATATSTTSSSGNSRGSSRRAGPTCCCATCATVTRDLAAVASRSSPPRRSAWPRPPRPPRHRVRPDVAALARKHGVEAGRPRGLARLPRHRLRRRGQARQGIFTNKIDERVGLRLRQRLGQRRHAAAGRQFVRPARAHSRAT